MTSISDKVIELYKKYKLFFNITGIIFLVIMSILMHISSAMMWYGISYFFICANDHGKICIPLCTTLFALLTPIFLVTIIAWCVVILVISMKFCGCIKINIPLPCMQDEENVSDDSSDGSANSNTG